MPGSTCGMPARSRSRSRNRSRRRSPNEKTGEVALAALSRPGGGGPGRRLCHRSTLGSRPSRREGDEAHSLPHAALHRRAHLFQQRGLDRGAGRRRRGLRVQLAEPAGSTSSTSALRERLGKAALALLLVPSAAMAEPAVTAAATNQADYTALYYGEQSRVQV